MAADDEQQPQAQPQPRVDALVKAAAAGETAKIAGQAAAGGVIAPAAAVGAPPAKTAGGVVSLVWHSAKWALILKILRRLFARHRAESADWLTQQLTAMFPDVDAHVIRQVVEAELDLERKFQAKAQKRVERDYYAAGQLPTPEQQAARIKQVMAREQHYAALRQKAMMDRAKATVANAAVKDQSPAGAKWMLGQAKNHTPACIALHGKVLPWAVLDMISPPIHTGCQCRLAPLGPNDTVPPAGEAMAMAKAALALEEAIEAVADPGEIEAYLRGLEVRPSIARALALLEGADWRELYPSTVTEADSGAENVQEAHWMDWLHPRGRGGKWIDKPGGGGKLFEPGHYTPPPPPKPPKIIGGDAPEPTHQGPIPSYRHIPLELHGKAFDYGKGAVKAKGAGKDFIVNEQHGDRDRVASELLSNAVYRTLGVQTPPIGHVQTEGGPDFSQRPDDLPNEPPIEAHGERVSTGIILREPDGRVTLVEPRGHYGGYCVPLDTQILTRVGWKRHDEVLEGEETIGFDPITGESRWTRITAVHHLDEEPLVRYGTKKWSVRCTPAHEWLVTRHGIVTKARADTRLREGESLLLAASHREGEDIDLVAAALLAWVVTDGTVESRSGGARIAQAKPAGRNALTALLEEVDHVETVGGFRLPAHVWRDVKRMTGWSGDREDLPSVVLRMGEAALAAFYSAAYMAEGDVSSGRSRLWQNEGPVADALAIVAFRLGKAPVMRPHGGRVLQSIAVNRATISHKRVGAVNEGCEPVWCVTTELGSWTMLQEGRIALTGNSHTFPKGGVEPYLTPQQNAHKELYEEAGLHGHITGVVGDFEGDTGITRYYAGVRTGGDPADFGEETQAVKTVTPEEAEKLLNRPRDKDVLKTLVAQPAPTGTFPDNFPPEVPGSASAMIVPEGKKRTVREPSEVLGKDYMVDALLANRDFLGRNGENVRWPDDNTPVRVNMASTLGYSPAGKRDFGDVPEEIWTMRYRGQAAGTVPQNEEALRQQAHDIAERLTDAKIDELTKAAPFASEAKRKEIADTLKARVGWMRQFANGEVDLPKPLEGAEARQMHATAQRDFEVYPEEQQALEQYAGDAGRTLDGHLRTGKPDDFTDADRKLAKRLDAVLGDTSTDGDSYAYMGAEAAPTQDMVGKTFSMKSYTRAHTAKTRTKGNARVRLLVPGGARALYLDGAEKDEPDLLLPRDQRILMTGLSRAADGTPTLEGQLLPYRQPSRIPSAYKPSQTSFGFGSTTVGPSGGSEKFFKGDRVDINGNKATVTGYAGKGMVNIRTDNGKGYTVPHTSLKRLQAKSTPKKEWFNAGDEVTVGGERGTVIGNAGGGKARVLMDDPPKQVTVPYTSLKRHLAEVSWREWLHPRGRGGEWIGSGRPSHSSPVDAIIESLGGKHGDDAYQALASGAATDTQKLHRVEGKYTEARQQLHQQIIDHFFADAKPAEGKAKAIFTAGGAASGKSALAGQASPERNLDIPDGAVYINPDDIKEMLPEYGTLKQQGRADIAAAATHEESSDLAKLMTALAMRENYPVVVDGTGNSKIGKFGKKLAAARAAGYDVEARYAHVPVEEAIAREHKRAERTGRKVAEPLLRDQHRTVAQSYKHVVAMPDVHVKVYSTVERGKPTLIAQKRPGEPVHVTDEKQYDEHLAKADA